MYKCIFVIDIFVMCKQHSMVDIFVIFMGKTKNLVWKQITGNDKRVP